MKPAAAVKGRKGREGKIMKFNDATSILFDSIDWSDLASTIGGTIHGKTHILDLQRASRGEQEPPDGWEHAISRLAKQRIRILEKLVKEIDARAE
jgi:hypothetical protein